MNKRNIILITLDSVRSDHCSFMGYPRETTPFIKKLARKGLYFENAIASGVATPTSMFGVHTGTYPNATYEVGKLSSREWREELQLRRTLAQILKKSGYFTGAVHANPAVSRFFGFNKGFDYFQDMTNCQKNNLTKLRKILGLRLYNFIKNTVTIIKQEETATSWYKLMPYILEFLRIAKKKNMPYFLWILLLDTHIPYLPPKNFRKWCSLPTPYIAYLNWKIRKNYLSKSNISKKNIENIIDVYDDSIRFADEFVKFFWNIVKDDDPIFIIHADHGEGFGDHNFFYHPAYLYDELIHVPLIISNIDDFKMTTIDTPVSLIGLSPTILELIGINNIFPSKSFLNVNFKYVLSKVFDGKKWKISVRSKNWKYIMGQKNIDELYFIKKDTTEQENLINEHIDIAKDLKIIIKQHLKKYKKVEILKAVQKIKRLNRL